MTLEIDWIVKGLLTIAAGGMLTLNGKLVYDGVKSHRAKKNSNGKYDRRTYVNTTDCINKHTNTDNKISEVHERVNEIAKTTSNMEGYLKGKLGE